MGYERWWKDGWRRQEGGQRCRFRRRVPFAFSVRSSSQHTMRNGTRGVELCVRRSSTRRFTATFCSARRIRLFSPSIACPPATFVIGILPPGVLDRSLIAARLTTVGSPPRLHIAEDTQLLQAFVMIRHSSFSGSPAPHSPSSPVN